MCNGFARRQEMPFETGAFRRHENQLAAQMQNLKSAGGGIKSGIGEFRLVDDNPVELRGSAGELSGAMTLQTAETPNSFPHF